MRARPPPAAFGWTHQLLGPEMGEYVCFVDTEGNRNSMIQPDMAPPACNT